MQTEIQGMVACKFSYIQCYNGCLINITIAAHFYTGGTIINTAYKGLYT